MPSTQRGAGWAWPLFMVLKVARRRTYVKYIYDLINIWEGPGIKGGEGEPGTPTEGKEGLTTDFRDDTDGAGKGGTRIKGGTGLSTKKCSKGQRWLVGLRISRVSDTLVVGHALQLGLRHSRGPREVDRTVG